MKSLGIIGGMGPLATVELYRKITLYTQAETDAQHIHIYIDSNTAIPDRTAAILNNGPSSAPQLISSAQKLEAAGADFLLMGCNTAHYYYSQVQASVQIPILNMIEETADAMATAGIHTAAVLSTSGLQSIGLYQNALQKRGIRALCPSPAQQPLVTSLIYDCVKAGRFHDFPIDPFLGLVENLTQQGAQAMLLGCTELPIAFEQFAIPTPLFDPTTILAQKAILTAGYTLRSL